jgi:hypothetical protein
MGKIVKLTFVALLAIAAFIVFSPRNNSSSNSQQSASPVKEQSIDFSAPIHTKPSALVCPEGAASDNREGRGLEGAVQAHLSVLDHDKDIDQSGCEEWKSGIPISLTNEGIKDAADFDARGLCGMVRFEEGYIFSCDLQNKP